MKNYRTKIGKLADKERMPSHQQRLGIMADEVLL
jgi:hypothetical protein